MAAHPAEPCGDGSAEPVVDVEGQEAAHADEEALWRRGEEIWINRVTAKATRIRELKFSRTPSSRERRFHVCSDGGEHGQSDREQKRHTERHDPDLRVKQEKTPLNALHRMFNQLRLYW